MNRGHPWTGVHHAVRGVDELAVGVVKCDQSRVEGRVEVHPRHGHHGRTAKGGVDFGKVSRARIPHIDIHRGVVQVAVGCRVNLDEKGVAQNERLRVVEVAVVVSAHGLVFRVGDEGTLPLKAESDVFGTLPAIAREEG